MDWANLTTQQIGLLAVVATIASAFVAATSALAATAVSGWYTRRLQADAARREYRLRLLQPSIDEAESRIRILNVALLHAKDAKELLYPDGTEPVSRKVFVTPSEQLQAAARHFAFWDHMCFLALAGPESDQLSKDEEKWILERFERSALAFREAIENFIFGDRFKWLLSRSLREERAADIRQVEDLLLGLKVRYARSSATGADKAPSNQALQPTSDGAVVLESETPGAVARG